MSEGAAFSERTVDVGGPALRLVEAGQGAPVIVLAGACRFTGSPAHALLAAQRRTIVVEPEAHAEPERLGAAVAALVETMGVGRFGVIGMLDAAAACCWTAVRASGVDALVLVSPRGLTAATASGNDESGSDALLPGLAACGVPVLVLTGTRDASLPQDTGSRLCAALPRAHAIIVYAAGADIACDRPEAFVEVVADFLERKEQFIAARGNPVFAP